VIFADAGLSLKDVGAIDVSYDQLPTSHERTAAAADALVAAGMPRANVINAPMNRPDTENGFNAANIALIKHPHVDPSRVVLVGRSFGGLIVPRGASGEHRLAAMIVDPGQLEMGSAVMNRLGDLGQHLDDPAADARFEALLTIPALRTFLAPPDGHPRPDQRPRVLP